MAGGTSRAGLLGTGASAIRGAALARTWSDDTTAETVIEGAFDPGFDGDTFFLELDGQPTGWVFSPEGGQATADVVSEKLGADYITKKHLGNLKYNDFAVQCGIGMAKGMYQWIEDTWNQKYTRRNGAVVAADFNYKEQARRTFSDALITEVQIPALDGASKDPAYVSVTLTPTTISYTDKPGTNFGSSARQAAPVSFKLAIDGLDTSRVTNIEAFTVQQGFDTDQTTGQLEPTNLEIPNLAIWVDQAGAASWSAWEDDFLLNGNSGDDKERSGSLTFLDTKNAELLTLSFSHLGIFKGTPEALENNKDAIRRVKFEMYCESITMQLGGGAWA